MRINLHTHSNYSDGTISPRDIISLAIKKGIGYLALTDHDTVNGLMSIADDDKKDIKFINGIEISTRDHDYLHILGYNVDIKNRSFLSDIEDYRERRISRAKEIIKRLNDIKIDISFEELDVSTQTTVGRPHIADLLIKKGYGKTRSDVFHKYLIEGCYPYVKPRGPDIEEAMNTIRKANGIVILAHPSTVEGSFNVEELVKKGFDGIEVYYPTHTNNKIRKYFDIAKRNDLIATVGTDFHGPNTDRNIIDTFEYDSEKLLNIDRILKI